MTRLNIIDEFHDEIESIEVDLELQKVFEMANVVKFLECGENRLRHEIKEITSIDFKNNEITVMVYKG